MRRALTFAAVACFLALAAQAEPRVSLIERIEADLARDKAFTKVEREKYLAEFRSRLGAYAFDVIKGHRSQAADVLMTVVTEGSFEKNEISRTVAVAAAAYVAVSRGAPAAAVEGIALYGFSKKLGADQIEALANGYRDLTNFGVPAGVAEDLIYNAACNDWETNVFNTLKWGLVQAAKAGFDCRDFSHYMIGHYLEGRSRPGAMVSQAMRAFRDASLAGKKPELPPYKSPILEKPAKPVPKAVPPPSKTDAGLPAAPAKILDVLDRSIRTFLGAPYVWGGRTRRGTDCSGFVQTVFAEAGIDLPRSSRKQWKSGGRVERGKLRKGDLVFFHTIAQRVSHVGIVTDPAKKRFAHASSSRGVVISDLKSRCYSARYAGARRVISR
ncbi:MAG TPA: NlpC/P60 family protein [Myxococcota bacterium]|nr:NlpC/P60 family protein [Myxococcota bacterium]